MKSSEVRALLVKLEGECGDLDLHVYAPRAIDLKVTGVKYNNERGGVPAFEIDLTELR